MSLPEGMALPESTPRAAATVMLLRDSPSGLEVFLQRRVRGMPFAGGMTAFPGGGVDSRDAGSRSSVRWVGPEPAWWAQRFGCDVDQAHALVCAAVRETFEETGVLLAGEHADSVIGETTRLEPQRQALVERESSLADLLTEQDLVLRADLLSPWSNWVTPAAEPRRYDTHFFAAALPVEQSPHVTGGEAAVAYWRSPAGALADWQRGHNGLLPPTWVSLTELCDYGSVGEVLAADREVNKIIPKVVHRDGAWRIVLPDQPDGDGHVDA